LLLAATAAAAHDTFQKCCSYANFN